MNNRWRIEFFLRQQKLKDKTFAHPVNRDQLRQSAAELGVEFQEHVLFVALALKKLGLPA